MKKKRKNKIIKFVPRFNDIIFLIALYQLDFIPALFERFPTHPIKVALSKVFSSSRKGTLLTHFPWFIEPVERTSFVSVFSSFFLFAGFLCVLTHPHTESTYSIGRRKLRGFNIHNICTKNLHTYG